MSPCFQAPWWHGGHLRTVGHIGWLSRPPGAGLILLHEIGCSSVLGSSPTVHTHTLMYPEESYAMKHGPLTEMLCCMALKQDLLPLP